jgi:hypothetical protein
MAELTRVCKPGGRILIVTWCHRVLEAGEKTLKADEAALLKDICSAYYLPAWCSIADYARIAESNGLTVRASQTRHGSSVNPPRLSVSCAHRGADGGRWTVASGRRASRPGTGRTRCSRSGAR